MFIPHYLWALGILMPKSDYYQVHRRLIRRSGARLQRPIAHAVEIGMPLVFQRFASCNEVLHHKLAADRLATWRKRKARGRCFTMQHSITWYTMRSKKRRDNGHVPASLTRTLKKTQPRFCGHPIAKMDKVKLRRVSCPRPGIRTVGGLDRR